MSAAVDIIRTPQRAASVLSPIRLSILNALREPGSATSVAEGLGLTRQKVNYHLRALEDQGLVEHVEDRPRAGLTERIVRSTARHYLIASSLLGELEARPDAIGDRYSSAHLAACSARTVSEVAELRERAGQAGKRLPTLSLETAVRFRSPSDQAAFAEELANALTTLTARYHAGDAPGGRWFRVVIGAHPALAVPADEPNQREEEQDDDDD